MQCPESVEEMIDSLEDVIMSRGGVMPASYVHKLYRSDPTFQCIVKKAAGLKHFVESRPDRLEWRSGTICLSLARRRAMHGVPRPNTYCSDSGALKFLCDILEQNGGYMLAANIARHTSPTPGGQVPFFFKDGGLKKFVVGHPHLFEWVSDKNGGREMVRFARALPELKLMTWAAEV